MPNYLTMPKKSQILALLDLGWSYRRIEAETGVRRETVGRYDRTRSANAAKTFPGSDASPPGDPSARVGSDGLNAAKTFAGSDANPAKRSPAPHADHATGPRPIARRSRETRRGLSRQRSGRTWWRSSVTAQLRIGETVRRTIAPPASVGVFTVPCAEAQVDSSAARRRSTGRGRVASAWVFRMTLGHSRHGYEKRSWIKNSRPFSGCTSGPFATWAASRSGAPRQSESRRGARCFYDPDSHDVYLAFAAHWGFTSLPTQPRSPQENGKQERSGGYVKDNALKGRRFESLQAQNAFLRHWNRTVARLRIHGTTRRQVWTHFVEVEQRALQPLAVEAFPYFTAGERTVHTDGHVEVAAPSIGAAGAARPLVRVRWTRISSASSMRHARHGPCAGGGRRVRAARRRGEPRRASRRLSTTRRAVRARRPGAQTVGRRGAAARASAPPSHSGVLG